MKTAVLTAVTTMALAATALADAIESPSNGQVKPHFDIVRAAVTAGDGQLNFEIRVTGTVGAETPASTGGMLGSGVFAYVWPTSLDSAAVGFEPKQGILALAVTAHPDFDDTPNYDEDGDGNAANDGKTWHSHWVVLAKDDACQAGLKVQDIAPGVTVKLPATAPGVPLLLDSPDIRPALERSSVTLSVPMPEGGEVMSFDGVAAGLRVNTTMAAPLLCVTDVFKVASGDLSLPGKVAP